MKLEEITLERVKQSYAKTRLIPGVFQQRRRGYSGCALETLALELGLSHWIAVLDDETMLISFVDGFDGVPRQDGNNEQAYNRGAEIAVGLGLRAE